MKVVRCDTIHHKMTRGQQLTGECGEGEPSGQRPRATPELGEMVAEAQAWAGVPTPAYPLPEPLLVGVLWARLRLGQDPLSTTLCTPVGQMAFTHLSVQVWESRLVSMSNSREAPDRDCGFLATDAPWNLRGHPCISCSWGPGTGAQQALPRACSQISAPPAPSRRLPRGRRNQGKPQS